MRKTMTEGRMFKEAIRELAVAVLEFEETFEEIYPDDIVEDEVEDEVVTEEESKVVVLEGEVIDTPLEDSWTEDEIRERQIQTWERYYEVKRKKMISEYTEMYELAKQMQIKVKKTKLKADWMKMHEFLQKAAVYDYLKEEFENLYYLKDNSYDFLNNIEKTEYAGHEIVLDWSDDYDEVAIRIIK